MKKLKKLTAAALAVIMTTASLPTVTAEECVSAFDVLKSAGAVSQLSDGEESPAGDFEYQIDGDIVTIVKYVGNGGNVVIPTEIEGKRVTKIGDSAFKDCITVTLVEMSDNVTEIESNSFSGCISLTSIKISESVTKIGYHAFYGCISLVSMKIPDGVTVIEHELFDGCSSLTSVEIPNGVTKIGYKAFYKCSSLTSVNIPNTVTEIEFFAFSYCSSLTLIEIPESVTEIGEGAFSDCDSLTAINADENNTSFSSSDGVLFNKNKTSLMQYPISKPEKRYSIPNSVIVIEKRAFSGSKFLCTVEVPNSVIKIDMHAFINCKVLASAIILNSKVLIGDSAFSSYIHLTLYSSEGSTAQAYAENKSFVFFKALGKEAAINIETGVLIENPYLQDTILEVEKTDETTEDKIIYNITLKDKDNKEIQPTGEVTVKIPIPEGWDAEKTIVSRREADGKLTDMKAVCQNGYAIFTTDHFSEYVLALKPEVQLGDINNDTQTNAVDAKMILQYASGSRKFDDKQLMAADVNGDGNVNAIDAKYILQYVSGSRDLS